MKQPVTASAPGKLVLTGEYAVLDGAPALAMAVNRRAVVTLHPSDNYQVSAPGLLSTPATFSRDDSDRLMWRDTDTAARQKLALFERIVTPLLAQTAHQPFIATLDTRAFFGAGGNKLGVGSSAALAMSLTAALRHYLELPGLANQALLRELLRHHRGAQQGRGSGIDLATSLYGGTILYNLEASVPHVRRVALPASLRFLCVWTGTSTSTARFLAHIADWKQAQPVSARKALSDLAESAHKAARGLEDVYELLRGIDAYGAALDQLGENAGLAVFSQAHRQIKKIAAGHGAVYKPSGAGGGDVGLAFTADAARLPALRTALVAAGFQCPDLHCSNEGLIIHA